MHPAITKTFGGLGLRQYSRHFIFGLIFTAFYAFLLTKPGAHFRWDMAMLIVANTLLYPFSRFLYETAIRFLMGDSVLYGPALIFGFLTLMTMCLCWVFAVFLAPLGLLILYLRNR